MRRTGIIVFVYAVLAFALCLLLSVLEKNLPILLPNEENSYIFCRGFLYFCKLLPSLIFCGFLIGCAIAFGKDSQKAGIKYSPLIMNHFKKVIIASIMLVFLIAMISEVFLPTIEQKQTKAKLKPHAFAEFLDLSRKYFEDGNMSLAFEYSYNALLLNPKDKEALYIKEHSEAELNSLKMVFDRPEETKFVYVPHKETKGETVTSLINKAKDSISKEKWFDAHYYAYLAVSIGTSKDINFDEANRIASEAWNHLFDPTVIKESEEQIIFRKKRQAYKTLIRGDNVEAYYEFLEIAEISDVAARDPDVAKFLAIAGERVKEQCFFVEEVENLRRFESYTNVYFSVTHDDGSKDVVHIRGITPVKNSGRMIQYLRGFSLFTYDKKGRFVRSIFVPYAKMLSQNVATFDAEAKVKFGIKDSYKQVPYLMLESICRTDRNGRVSPVFEYDAAFAQANEIDLNNYFVLGLPMSDFNLLCDATAGSFKMNLISLLKFISKTRNYGYSFEVYASDFIYRILYPLIVLICLVFLACIAWNYRLESGQLFKFKWIFLMPPLTVLIYFVYEYGLYEFKLFNYALVIALGGAAVFVSAVTLIIALLIVCYIFVSRTAE